MIDIFWLVIIPIACWIVVLVYSVRKNERIAFSHNLNDRITKISRSPRKVKDKNHKLSHINKLMLPEDGECFNDDMFKFIQQNLKQIR